jgi:multiple sugar transport system substrate-binding protein
MKDFYNSGVLPREFVKFQTENVISFMQQGRAAMAITPISRFTQLNNPDSSRFPGQIVSAALPVSDELKAKYGVAPVKSEFWVLAIPKNAKNKSASWDFIRYASTPDASLKAGLNGNGPVRRSTLTDKKYRDSIPYAEAEAAALKFARPPLPGWENSSKVEDIFRDEVESMLITASKTPQETVTNIAKLVGPLLPK